MTHEEDEDDDEVEDGFGHDHFDDVLRFGFSFGPNGMRIQEPQLFGRILQDMEDILAGIGSFGRGERHLLFSPGVFFSAQVITNQYSVVLSTVHIVLKQLHRNIKITKIFLLIYSISLMSISEATAKVPEMIFNFVHKSSFLTIFFELFIVLY